MKTQAYAAQLACGKLEVFEYNSGQLRPDEVEVHVKFCDVCHRDLSMLDDEWNITKYPFVPGHEIIGTVSEVGNDVKHLKVGQYVGIGWRARSCLYCDQCMSGHHNRCLKGEDVIVGRHGGYADKVRCQAIFAFLLSPNIDTRATGPLFCGGITVFNPIIQNDIRGTDNVAVVGIAGLGHMALQFLNSWGCEITAFSANSEKEKDARKLGAHNFLNSRDPVAIKSATNSFDLVLVIANADLD
jgi:alcohol/geraniol dehydrogenase (NADP+)